MGMEPAKVLQLVWGEAYDQDKVALRLRDFRVCGMRGVAGGCAIGTGRGSARHW
jgi:hypothetical protein